jgi:hypothetical protein
MKTLTVAHVTTAEAEHAIKRWGNSPTMLTYGVEIFTEEAEPVVLDADHWLPGVFLKVRAETDVQAGIGMGFLLGKI